MAEAKKVGQEEVVAVVATEVVAENANIVGDFYEEKGKESLENLQKGGKEVTVSLTNTTEVEFIEDYGQHIKKGHVQAVSDVVFEIYNKAGVIKKL